MDTSDDDQVNPMVAAAPFKSRAVALSRIVSPTASMVGDGVVIVTNSGWLDGPEGSRAQFTRSKDTHNGNKAGPIDPLRQFLIRPRIALQFMKGLRARLADGSSRTRRFN